MTVTLNVGEKVGNFDGQINITKDRSSGERTCTVEYCNSAVDLESGDLFKKI